MSSAAVIHKDQGRSTERSDHNIHPAVVIQIAERGTAAGNRG